MDFIKEHQGWFSFFLFVAITLLLFFELPLGESLGLINNPFFFSLQSLATPAANLNIALLGGVAGVLSVKAALTLGSSLIRHTHATTTIHPNPVDDDEIIEVERIRRNGPKKIIIDFFKDNEAWLTFFVYGSSSTTLFLKLPFEALLPFAPFFAHLGPLALSAASFSVSTMGGMVSAGVFRLGMHIVRAYTRTQEPERHPHPLAPVVEEQRGNHRASPRPSVASSVTISQQLPPLHPAGQLRIRADRSSAFLRRLDGVEEVSPGGRTLRSPSPVGVSLDSPRTRAHELQQYPGAFLRRQGSAASLGRDIEEARSPGGRGLSTRSSHDLSPIAGKTAS
jgi:hypothetical protein